MSSFLQRMGRTGRRAGSRRNCTFLTLNDRGLAMALAVVTLWRRGWVEDAIPPQQPWGVVAQQALASVLESGEVAARELMQSLAQALPELETEGLECLTQHLVDQGFLTESSRGLWIVGPKTEERYGRGHYRDLLATFSGDPLLLGRSGSSRDRLGGPEQPCGQRLSSGHPARRPELAGQRGGLAKAHRLA
ncbi:MAG: hypothetical protein MZW92_66035 [Comamonadaceae bacterium]|nr:hypothetical protein [Comamonadaceae bacterium]